MSYIWRSLFLLFELLLFDRIIKCGTEPLSPRSVKTKYGVVRGVLRNYNKQNVPELPSPLSQLPDKFSVEIFRSVPFAQPAVSNLRFLPPVTQARWRGTKLSNRFLPVCMQNTAEIASSDLLFTSPLVDTSVNKDKIHEFLSTSATLSSVTSSSASFKSLSTNTTASISALSFAPNDKNLKRTRREGEFSPIKHENVHDSNRSLNVNIISNTERRSARLSDEFDGQFDQNFISDLLRIHPVYFQPFASYIRNQNEDCLYLNLYVPYEDNLNHEQYPVIVFVHGESFEWGSGNAYDGSILAGIGKVIVVTLNYRLGVFGFMPSLIEGSVRTNHGLLDVVASLHWIQDNIAQFGGSTSNVQLIGHQRGAALVQFLMKSQLSKGLFQRAVLLSGSASSNWALADQTEFYTRTLASKVDCGLEPSKTPEAANSFRNPNSSNGEAKDLFRLMSRFSNQITDNHQLSNADERIFQCLRSRSSEQLRTASIRLTTSYYSPFHSLFGPTIDSLLISDDQAQSFTNHFSHQHTNQSNHLNRKSKFAITNSNHDLLIGYSANSPRFRPSLKRMFSTIVQLPNKSGLHFFYQFLKDFVRYVNSLIRDESLNDQNDFNEISILISELSSSSPSVNLKNDLSSTSNATNWLWRKQDDLLNIISALLLDVLIVAPLFSVANSHQPGSVYAFFLPHEQDDDEFSDQELALLFGSSLAGYYFNVTDGLGRFRTNQTSLKQVQQSQKLISVFLNFFRTGQPSRSIQDQIPAWPAYNKKSRNFLSMDKRWKIRQANTGRLNRWLKLVNILDEEQSTKESSLSSIQRKLSNEVRISEKLPQDLRRGQLESILELLVKQLDLRIKNVRPIVKQSLMQQHFKSRTSFNSNQMNKSNESPDPGGGIINSKSISRSPLVDHSQPDLRKSSPQNSNQLHGYSNDSQILTGNLARIKENSITNKIELSNQTTDKNKFLSQLFSSIGLASSDLEAANEKNKMFYTNVMIAIITAGLAMLFINIFVLFLGYKCIRRRRILKRKDQRSKESENLKENLSTIPCQANLMINSTPNSNTVGSLNYNQTLQTGNLIGNLMESGEKGEKCYCGGEQFCNCVNEIDKLQLINSDSSFFTTTDTIITDQPLSQLVSLNESTFHSPVCKLINADSYETSDMVKVNLKSPSTINDRLTTLNERNLNKQYSTSNTVNNCRLTNSLSANQLTKGEENNCECIATNNNLLTSTPMLAVLESTGDSNLLTELSTIGCDSNFYKFFESNYYAPYNLNNINNINPTTPLQQHTNTLEPTSYPTSIPNTTVLSSATNTGSSTTGQSQQYGRLHPPLQAHNSQAIQLQLLSEHLLNTSLSQATNN